MTLGDQLHRLGEMHQRGALSNEEFLRAKTRMLSGTTAINALRRSRNDRWLGGVCGGLAVFSDVPAWIWRLIFVLLVLCAGTGIAFYLLCWFFMPNADSSSGAVRAEQPSTRG
jgi:phage shock protein PspC (stress-responsive transcriptional regulator)